MLRDIKAQYKQSLLGYAWIIVNPIGYLVILSFVFTKAFRAPVPDDVPFPLFLSIGMMPWIFFSNALSGSTISLVAAPNVLKSVYFPREMLVIAAALVRVVDLVAGLLIVAVLMVASGTSLNWTAIWVPPLIFIHLLFVLGCTLPLAALNLFYRDVRFLVSTALSLWFFVTPIFYTTSAVPSQYRFIYDLNPNARLIQSYRYALLDGVSPPIESIFWAGALSLISLIVGYYFFKKLEPVFADYV
jgi:lipopolysaccharide transport system permease protein